MGPVEGSAQRQENTEKNGKDENTKIRAVYSECKDFMQVVWDK